MSDKVGFRLVGIVLGASGFLLLYPLGWKIVLAVVLIVGSFEAHHMADEHSPPEEP